MSAEPATAVTVRLLDAAVGSLRRNVAPALSDPSVRLHVDLITRVLWLARYQLTDCAADQARLAHQQDALLSRVHHVVPDTATDTAHAVAVLKAAAPALMRAASVGGEAGAAARALVGDIVEMEATSIIAQDPDAALGSAIAYRGGMIETERAATTDGRADPDADRLHLEHHLRRLWGDPDVVIHALRIIPGGFSKKTAFVEGERATGLLRLVLRQDMTVPFMGKTVVDEWPLLTRLHAAGFPVARPVVVEPDPTVLGSPFLLSERVDGTTNFREWAGNVEAVRLFARQLARNMAALHRLDVETLGMTPNHGPTSAGALMRAELSRWAALFAALARPANLLVDLELAWLQENIPAASFRKPACIVHGDIGFHNLMVARERVTALLDWEFWHLGDPHEDLIYTKPFIEQIMPWPDFIDFYIQEGGTAPSADAELFYSIWPRVRNAIGSLDGGRMFDRHTPSEIKFAVSGHVFAPYLELEAARMMYEALAGRVNSGAEDRADLIL